MHYYTKSEVKYPLEESALEVAELVTKDHNNAGRPWQDFDLSEGYVGGVPSKLWGAEEMHPLVQDEKEDLEEKISIHEYTEERCVEDLGQGCESLHELLEQLPRRFPEVPIHETVKVARNTEMLERALCFLKVEAEQAPTGVIISWEFESLTYHRVVIGDFQFNKLLSWFTQSWTNRVNLMSSIMQTDEPQTGGIPQAEGLPSAPITIPLQEHFNWMCYNVETGVSTVRKGTVLLMSDDCKRMDRVSRIFVFSIRIYQLVQHFPVSGIVIRMDKDARRFVSRLVKLNGKLISMVAFVSSYYTQAVPGAQPGNPDPPMMIFSIPLKMFLNSFELGAGDLFFLMQLLGEELEFGLEKKLSRQTLLDLVRLVRSCNPVVVLDCEDNNTGKGISDWVAIEYPMLSGYSAIYGSDFQSLRSVAHFFTDTVVIGKGLTRENLVLGQCGVKIGLRWNGHCFEGTLDLDQVLSGNIQTEARHQRHLAINGVLSIVRTLDQMFFPKEQIPLVDMSARDSCIHGKMASYSNIRKFYPVFKRITLTTLRALPVSTPILGDGVKLCGVAGLKSRMAILRVGPGTLSYQKADPWLVTDRWMFVKRLALQQFVDLDDGTDALIAVSPVSTAMVVGLHPRNDMRLSYLNCVDRHSWKKIDALMVCSSDEVRWMDRNMWRIPGLDRIPVFVSRYKGAVVFGLPGVKAVSLQKVCFSPSASVAFSARKLQSNRFWVQIPIFPNATNVKLILDDVQSDPDEEKKRMISVTRSINSSGDSKKNSVKKTGFGRNC
jgi:hypothetical protein